jgi:hypothetical protein
MVKCLIAAIRFEGSFGDLREQGAQQHPHPRLACETIVVPKRELDKREAQISARNLQRRNGKLRESNRRDRSESAQRQG